MDTMIQWVNDTVVRDRALLDSYSQTITGVIHGVEGAVVHIPVVLVRGSSFLLMGLSSPTTTS
jgi:hypothetical protein